MLLASCVIKLMRQSTIFTGLFQSRANQTGQPVLGSIIDVANSLSISSDERTNLLQLIVDSSRFAEGSGGFSIRHLAY